MASEEAGACPKRLLIPHGKSVLIPPFGPLERDIKLAIKPGVSFLAENKPVLKAGLHFSLHQDRLINPGRNWFPFLRTSTNEKGIGWDN